MKNNDLQGRTALVCGASRGIGLATAHALATQGCRVVLLARKEPDLRRALDELKATNPGEHAYIVGDAGEPTSVARSVGSWVERYGAFHILVNNSGGPPPGPIQGARSEAFLVAFTQHLLAAHELSQCLIPGMKGAGYGRIINVISTSVKQPLRGLGVSNTIRASVASWAKTLSAEVAPHGITVNNVLPGATRTERLEQIIGGKASHDGRSVEEVEREMLEKIPAGRFGRPDEIAAAIAFLAGPSAGYINGINLPVDGGRTGCL
ncbi:MAG: SDR family oxidoreductase [Sphingomonadales bacterium]|nr:SDR family oxidoreductase [Sphingomonadales bacterium]